MSDNRFTKVVYLIPRDGIGGVEVAARTLPSAVYNICKKFDLFNQSELKKFKMWDKFYLYNHAKVKIGHIKTIIE